MILMELTLIQKLKLLQVNQLSQLTSTPLAQKQKRRRRRLKTTKTNNIPVNIVASTTLLLMRILMTCIVSRNVLCYVNALDAVRCSRYQISIITWPTSVTIAALSSCALVAKSQFPRTNTHNMWKRSYATWVRIQPRPTDVLCATRTSLQEMRDGSNTCL